jgi:Cof subfamily protein (haloacid dehalogenase superfamily)
VIRLLAIDIDGTLLNSAGRIPEAHRDALAAAAAQGIAVALVTGRSFHFTRPIAEALRVALTAIVNNGAVIKDQRGATVLHNLLPRDVARHVLTQTRAFEDSVAAVFDRQPGDEDERQIVFERMDWTHPNRRGYYRKNEAFIAPAPSLVEALVADPIQLMFSGEVGPMRRLVGELRALPRASEFSVALTEYEARDFSLVDVNAAGCTKGTTLARWAERIGVAAAEVMAVGDNFNDLEMLEYAGIGVVMGNAADAIKARGFHQTTSNDEDGLAHAIRRYALTEP